MEFICEPSPKLAHSPCLYGFLMKHLTLAMSNTLVWVVWEFVTYNQESHRLTARHCFILYLQGCAHPPLARSLGILRSLKTDWRQKRETHQSPFFQLTDGAATRVTF